MNRIFLSLTVLAFILFFSCRDDESHNVTPVPDKPRTISLDITSRVGTKIGEDLTTYVKSLHLMLFRQDASGEYLLVRNQTLNKNQLKTLTIDGTANAGFTTPRIITFDSLTLGNYRVVGVGNMTDSVGGVLPNASLTGLQIGQSISSVLAVIKDGDMAPRLFWGITDVVTVGALQILPPVLKLYRKVAMFALTVKAIPAVVGRIDMTILNTSGAFNMLGNFPANNNIFVMDTRSYSPQAGDSTILTYITLPTLIGNQSAFTITFYLDGGTKQVITLPSYILKENTITRLTATIDIDQPGGQWKVDATFAITADVEWNVDQEPPIII